MVGEFELSTSDIIGQVLKALNDSYFGVDQCVQCNSFAV